ncbi:MlaD family protein [Pseudonocardia acaciae]|uniref:MlaD family protein n=1 Tax=Pseudonocardia acaciae TaxID=551276 RepID=UPI0006888BF0|nr:MlaD family protein [Pseudonocardia acaciae]
MTAPELTARRRRRVTGVALVLVAALVGAIAVVTLAGGHRTTTLTAVFADSSPLVAGNKVQMNGAEVGKITAIRLVNGQARVEMTVDRSVYPLHADASARIEPVSLLGERFVALKQGTPAAPVLPEPTVIAVEHTSAAVDLDQLLNTLDDPTSTALAAMVTTLGEGLGGPNGGQGDKVAQALRGLEPTLRQVDELSRLLDRQNQVLDHLVVSSQRNATAFAQPLDSLVDGANRTLGAVAANRQATDATLAELPSTLASARRTLGHLGDAADNGAGMLRDIRPVTDDLVDVSRELHDFADAANPALESLPDALHRLDVLLDEARPVVRDLRSVAADLRSVSGSVHDLGHQVLKHRPGQASQLENLMTGVADWAMATSGYDGLSHYFRAVLVMSPSSNLNTVAGGLPALTPAPPFNPVPKDPSGQSGRPGTPRLPFLPGGPNPDAPDAGGSAEPKGDPNSATGLSQEQESNLFDQLLGPGTGKPGAAKPGTGRQGGN